MSDIPNLPSDSVHEPQSKHPQPSNLPYTTANNEQMAALELWKPIVGYEGSYEVSNTGKIKSLPRATTKGGLLKQSSRFRNYQAVSLSVANKQKMHYVHRLVASHFLQNPDNKLTVNHKDSDPTNNHISNLEWATHAENEQHAYDNGKVVWNKGRLGIAAHLPRQLTNPKEAV